MIRVSSSEADFSQKMAEYNQRICFWECIQIIGNVIIFTLIAAAFGIVYAKGALKGDWRVILSLLLPGALFLLTVNGVPMVYRRSIQKPTIELKPEQPAVVKEEEPVKKVPESVHIQVSYRELPFFPFQLTNKPYENSNIKKFELQPLKKVEIEVKPYKRPKNYVIHLNHRVGMDPERVRRLFEHVLSLSTNPLLLFSYLQPLEQLIEQKLKERNISFSEKDNPSYMIAGHGYFLPGPPRHLLKKKSKIIEEAIRECEKSFGINKKGVPVFIGFVQREEAIELIQEGYVFKEDPQVSRSLLHGKNTHRLFMLALLSSLKESEFADLSAKEILTILVNSKVPIPFSMIAEDTGWTFLFDSLHDHPKEILTDPKKFNYSCRNPFVMNSLLLCFGNHFDLSNLMFCMRDSHWKQVEKISKRPPNFSHDEVIMSLFAMSPKGEPGNLGVTASHLVSVAEMDADPKYRAFSYSKVIKEKIVS